MKHARTLLAIAALSTVALFCGANEAQARGPFSPWHGNYYHPSYGAPVALVTPPIVHRETQYQWGAAGTSVTPIWPKFRRGYNAQFGSGTVSYPPPRWPYHTDQLGVYYIRGPH